MKIISLLLVATVAAAAFLSDRQEFEAWARLHQKVYSSGEIDNIFKTWKANADFVRNSNAGGANAVFTMNQFADMSAESFAKTILMRPRRPATFEQSRYADMASVKDLPDTFDWRDHGAVTPVKDQGTVGSCWAFSTTGNIEGQLFLNKLVANVTALSEEQLVDCDDKDCGVFGGWPNHAMEYLIENGGLETEADYPYCCGTGDCYPCMANKNVTFCGPPPSYCARHCLFDPNKAFARLYNWQAISQDETQIQAQLVARGPLSVLLNAGSLQFYHHGVWDPYVCDPSALDHAVLLVGYGTDKDLFGKEEPYWLVKNSWGVKWGMNGYFKIARGKGKCGINTTVVTAIVKQ